MAFAALSVVAHDCNLSTLEAERLDHKFEASLS